MDIQQAIDLFDKEKYRDAFSAFAEIYNDSVDQKLRSDIMTFLMESFYFPNAEEMKAQYDYNISLLEQYPYFLDKKFCSYEDLPFWLFPIEDDLYYYYDQTADRFVQEYEPKTKKEMQYFFRELEDCLLIEDEKNFYHLNFLNDTVRASIDYGADNHIYLYYTSFFLFAPILISCDLEAILKNEKFVFLIGIENRSFYPLDFKTRYGIDYSNLEPQPIRPEEVNRICYWYKHAVAGTVFATDILNTSPYMQLVCLHNLYTYSKVNGKSIDLEKMKSLFTHTEKIFSLNDVEVFLNQPENDIDLPQAQEAIIWARNTWVDQEEYSVKDLFILYFLYLYQKKGVHTRIAPILLLDPHIWQCDIHNSLIRSFPYYVVLTSMRNPIQSYASSYLSGLIGWNQFQTQYLLASDYLHTQFLDKEMLDVYYGFRFEDLKMKPEASCRSICRTLNIPFDTQMLQVDAPYTNGLGETIRGFDQTPLHRDISAVLSDFDQLRLQMFYTPILKYYGYPYFPFEEYPLSDDMVRSLLSYPLRFEGYTQTYVDPSITPETLHGWIQAVLQQYHKDLSFVSPILIKPEEVE